MGTTKPAEPPATTKTVTCPGKNKTFAAKEQVGEAIDEFWEHDSTVGNRTGADVVSEVWPSEHTILYHMRRLTGGGPIGGGLASTKGVPHAKVLHHHYRLGAKRVPSMEHSIPGHLSGWPTTAYSPRE